MAKQRFQISRYSNPSGEEVWRLSGTLNGKRIRKNFQSRAEAVAERQKLDVEHLNGQSDGQTVWTTLTQEQNRDAIAAVNRLKNARSDKSLDFAVDFFLRHYREPSEAVTVETAVREYLKLKQRELERGTLSAPHRKSLSMAMRRFEARFAGREVSDILPQELVQYLEDRGGSLKSWNNRRGYLSTFFKFCLKQKYVSANPVLEVEQFKIRKARATAETLPAARAAELMRWLEAYRGQQNKRGTWWGEKGCMVPYFALTLFAGIRPDWQHGEIGKLRPQDIRLDTGVIFVEPEVSKVNEKRVIKIQPNLRVWLERYPLSRYPIMPTRRFVDMWLDIRKHWELGHDVLRHTYISMTVGAFRSVGDAALQSGNSEAVVRKHYLDLYSVEEADAFWSTLPKGTAAPRWRKEDGRYLSE